MFLFAKSVFLTPAIFHAIILICFSCKEVSTDTFNVDLDPVWELYKKIYAKSYNDDEDDQRRLIWENEVLNCFIHNLQADMGLSSYRMGVNKLSDKTDDEIKTYYKGYKDPGYRGNSTAWLRASNVDPPDAVDWRDEGLVTRVKDQDAEGYRRWVRMDTSTFQFLLIQITPYISRKDTNMRKAISPGEKLALTLRYLASGETQSSLSYQFRIAQNTISGILKEVCNAIIQVLKDHLHVPSNESEWAAISAEFDNMWQFPMCIGALDGKNVKISPPPNSGSLYYNYKGDFSIVLMALVDPNLKFIFVDVGTNGRISDGGVWGKCKLKLALDSNSVNIPKANNLPLTTTKVPYVIVADDAFPLSLNLMKPYPGRGLNAEERIFNYRLSRARRVSENAFGILAARFQIFKQRILTCPQNATKIVIACCALHNFLISKNTALYIPDSSIDTEIIDKKEIKRGSWRDFRSEALVPLAKGKCKPGQLAKDVRDNFCTYFNNVGAVSWQAEMCLLH